MTRRELLQEQYEDALFALLMDDLAIEQGKAALEENEKLKLNPAAAVPLPLQQRSLKLISNYYSKQHFYTIRRTCYKVLNKVAIVALVSMLLFTTAFAASPSFRLNALNLMIDAFDDRTNLQLSAENIDNQSSTDYEIVVDWLPAGYELSSYSSDSRSSRYFYQSQDGEIVQISIAFKDGMIVSIDTEEADVESITVQDIAALLSQKDSSYQIAWADEQAGVLWTIYGEGISKSDIIKIAENVRIK